MELSKKLIREQATYQPSEETLDAFLAKTDLRRLKPKETLIEIGELCDDIYIVKRGLLAHTYMDGSEERCGMFSIPGIFICSYPTLHENKPSHYRVFACCDTELIHMSRFDFEEMIAQSHDFARWVLSLGFHQVCATERKNTMIVNGNARQRLYGLMNVHWKEVLLYASGNLIASYLGITPQYLCRLRKEILTKG